MLVAITPATEIIDTPAAETPLRVIRVRDELPWGPPYALLYLDNCAPLWLVASRHNTTDSAAWEAHSVFGAPLPDQVPLTA